MADALSNDEICHLILVRCFGVAVSHERPEESIMKNETFVWVSVGTRTSCLGIVGYDDVQSTRTANSEVFAVAKGSMIREQLVLTLDHQLAKLMRGTSTVFGVRVASSRLDLASQTSRERVNHHGCPAARYQLAEGLVMLAVTPCIVTAGKKKRTSPFRDHAVCKNAPNHGGSTS